MHYFLLIGLAFTLISLVACRPEWIGDGNGFMKNFVNHEFLNILGVFLAITLASLTQAHFSLNKLEERRGREFSNTRREIKEAATYLVVLFVAGFIVVSVKPLIPGEVAEAVSNSLSVIILAFYIMVLHDVTIAVLSIRASDD